MLALERVLKELAHCLRGVSALKLSSLGRGEARLRPWVDQEKDCSEKLCPLCFNLLIQGVAVQTATVMTPKFTEPGLDKHIEPACATTLQKNQHIN